MSNLAQILEVLLLITVPIMAIGLTFPLGRVLAKRFDAETALRRDDAVTEIKSQVAILVEARIEGRLRGIEHAVEAVAVEIERIGEAQRYSRRQIEGANFDTGDVPRNT